MKDCLKVVFLHHHLRPGGVSGVIVRQVEALKGIVDPLLVLGEPPGVSINCKTAVVSPLGYDRDRKDRETPEDIAFLIKHEVSRVWPEGADLFHFHNPTLGKNRHLVKVIKILVEQGEKILLQIHDFAEDGRPQGYYPETYPRDCHYAVINKRDYRILLDAGLKQQGLHYIPNSVLPPGHAPSEGTTPELVLYPVRAIRRKNIGEAVLLSLFISDKYRVGLTLEPTGALDRECYREWKAFVSAMGLRVEFGLGLNQSLKSLLSKSVCTITTSIKEGFGLSFLEPWTVNHMLFGRILDDICRDFIDKGIELGHLYSMLRVPVEFFNFCNFREKWMLCYMEKLNKYGMPFLQESAEQGFEKITQGGVVDFGTLSEQFQQEVIKNIIENNKKRKKFLDFNPFLERHYNFENYIRERWKEVIEKNRMVVETEYSQKNNRNILLGVYEKVIKKEVKHLINRAILLKAFNTPEQNRLLLCETSYGY